LAAIARASAEAAARPMPRAALVITATSPSRRKLMFVCLASLIQSYNSLGIAGFEGRKDFFSAEKKQKTFGSLSRLSPASRAKDAKVFWSFFQKRTSFSRLHYRVRFPCTERADCVAVRGPVGTACCPAFATYKAQKRPL
jgi:hypothetical protein